jgi:hypothetical protein
MKDTTVVLTPIKANGLLPFTFKSFEVPQSIPFGGDQHLTVHELIGGGRVIDAMGRRDRPIEWSGWFIGQDATERAQMLDVLRISGAQQKLTWNEYVYTVIVRSFTAEFQRFYQIPYRISFEVLSDLTTPILDPISVPIDQQVAADAAQAALIAAAVADQTLIAAISAIQTAAALIVSLATSPKSAITALGQSVLAGQTVCGDLIQNTETAMGTPTSFAGVVAGLDGASAAAALSTQTADCFMLVNLQQVSGLLGRISNNLASANSSPNTIAVAGGNLFAIAEEQYGDATAWTTIANANGLVDPFVQGVQTLVIPPQSDQSGGILSQ